MSYETRLVSALVDVHLCASDCSGGTPPFSFCLSSLSRATRSCFPLSPAQNPENVDEIMLRFKGREEELGKALRLMWERNMVQRRARAAVPRTTSLEAREGPRRWSAVRGRTPLPSSPTSAAAEFSRGGHHRALPCPLPRRGCPGSRRRQRKQLRQVLHHGVLRLGGERGREWPRQCDDEEELRAEGLRQHLGGRQPQPHHRRGTTDRTWRGTVLTARTNTSRAMGDWVASTCPTPASMARRMGGWAAQRGSSPARKEVRANFVSQLVPGPDNRKGDAIRRRCPPRGRSQDG